LSESFPNNIHSFVTTWTDTGLNTDYLKHFGESAFLLLCKLIDDDPQRLEITYLEDEIRWHQEYTRLKTWEFAGRKEFIHKIIKYCDDQKQYPLIIHGESGSGKTALLAQIARIHETQNNVLITRYIGVTPASTESHSLIESIIMQIASYYYLDISCAPIEYLINTGNGLKILSLALQTKPIILIIDGVDELDASGVEYFLNIITQELPSFVKCVLSVDSNSHLSKIFIQRLPSEHNIMLTPMPAIEAMSLLNGKLEHRRRKVRSDQFEEIIARFRSKGLPMYLSLAIDEVCNWHSFDLVKQLPDDVAGLLNNAFDRLEMQIGSMWIGKAISYIALSRFGLSESELFEILSNDEEIIHYLKDYRPDYMAINEIPRIVFLAIQSGLNPYLTNRRVHGVDVFTFSHKVIFETALQRYNICDRTMKRSAHHHLLAEYFCKHIIEKNADETLNPNVRALLEFVYHKAQY
jgi:NACHT domain- and WD repeat-containing protein